MRDILSQDIISCKEIYSGLLMGPIKYDKIKREYTQHGVSGHSWNGCWTEGKVLSCAF